jgi:hypothetical protein
MNKIITGACIIVICCFCACANNEQDQESNLTNTDSSKAVIITPNSQKMVNPGTTVPVSGQAVTTPLPQPVVNQAPLTITAPGMNPAHGQPNHRCDIAVGAPLNSPVAKPVNQTANTPVVPSIATPVQTTTQIETPAGMNPPHGKPGHRCDIAVGAPLNSPVTKPATQTITPTPVIVPPKKDSGS